jgi:hypothetical protein
MYRRGTIYGAVPAAPAAIEQDARRRHVLKIHKPSVRVSFGLPGPLSFQVRSHVIVARRSGTNTRQGKRQGQAAKQPDPPSWNAMRASQKSKRKMAKSNRTFVSSTLSMATHSLVNMVAITAVSGAVLLALLAAKRF